MNRYAMYFTAYVGFAIVPAVSPADEPMHRTVEAFFDSDSPFIQETVLPNVERHRKADARLLLQASDGQSLSGVKISVELLRHQFHFGCAPRRELSVDGPYRKAWINIWEYAVPENAQKWASIERSEGKRDFATSDAIVDFLNAQQCPVEYHFLSGYHPEWINEKSPEEMTKSQRHHMLETVERYKDSVEYFQVYNEFWRCPVSRAAAFVPSKEFFAELTTAYPDEKFGVSDCWRLNEPLPTEEEMRARFPGLDFIAIHAHRPRRLHVTPEVIYECFDPYVSSDIKLHVSEFGIREGTIQYTDRLEPDWSASNRDQPDESDGLKWTEQRKAEYFVQTIVTCFSHPAVRAFNLWGMGPGNMFMDGNRLIEDDYSPRPTYHALRYLIKEKLRTRANGTTDSDGYFKFRGFHGRYRITATTTGGKTTESEFTLNPESGEITLLCN
jgi:endo-1,4-beta-xylanase